MKRSLVPFMGAILLAVIPVVWLGHFVAGTEQSVPALDQWTLFEFYYDVATGRATLAQFFEPHNNTHVILVPRLLLTPLALATDWNLPAESYGTYLLFLFTLGGLVRLTWKEGARTPFAALVLIASVSLLCSPVFNLTFLWGGGFFHMLVNVGAVWAVVFLNEAHQKGQARWIVWAGLATAVATFSRLEGFALWFVLLPGVYGLPGTTRQRRQRLGAWLGATAACGSLLLFSLTALQGEVLAPSPAIDLNPRLVPLMIATALQLVGHALAMPLDLALGLSVLDVPLLAFTLGAIVVIAFCILSLWQLRSGPPHSRSIAISWILLGLFALCMAGGTSFTRAVLLQKSLAQFVGINMYSATVVWVTVASLNLLPKYPTAPSWLRQGGLAFGTLILATTLYSFIQATPLAYAHREVGSTTFHCWDLRLLLSKENSCFYHLPDETVQTQLEEVGFRHVRRDLLFGPPLSPDSGGIETIEPTADQLIVEGWIDPNHLMGRPSVWVSSSDSGRLTHWAQWTDRTDASRWRWRAEIAGAGRGADTVQVWLYADESSALAELSALGSAHLLPSKGRASAP